MRDASAAGQQEHGNPPEGPIGMVLVGGGARGAYEAGVLSVLLPAMEEHDQRPTVLVGTSAGAINAVLFAALAHLPAKEAADEALRLWRSAGREDVIGPLLPSAVRASVQFVAGLARLSPHLRLSGLLDATPLWSTVDEWLDWDRLHANARPGGFLHAVAVVATASPAGRSVVFVEGPQAGLLPSHDTARALDYRPTRLATEHVLASAAIPVLFPPVRVEHPVASRGWYLDGGVQFNAPIKPALALGVGRLVVVATEPFAHPSPYRPDGELRPDVYDTGAQVLRAVLNDQMTEDVRTLGKLNELIAAGAPVTGQDGHQEATRPPYRLVPYMFVGPQAPGELGRLADEVFRARYGGLRRLRHRPDFPLLSLLLGGGGHSHSELLSYLFFDPVFLDAAIEAGREDAQQLLDASGGGLPWRIGPSVG